MIWIYDIESYINYFAVIFKNIKTSEIREFIIFEDRNDLDDLHMFVSDYKKWMVGYNSFYFDNQILNFIYRRHPLLTFKSSDEVAGELYDLVMKIIEDDFTDFKYNLPFKSIDLMKLGGFQKSLKLIGVNLKWHKLQDLPIPMGSRIQATDLELLREYNLNDVLITEKLYYELLSDIKVRSEIEKLYGINVMSESDSGMANRLLEKFYSDTTGLSIRQFKGMRTERKFMKFDWIVFDEINFHTMTLMNLLEEVKEHVYYKDAPYFKKSVSFDGINYKLGVGGIHSVDTGELFQETEDIHLIDADIGSMYPTLIINHAISPEHLGGRFLSNYKDILDKRLEAKRDYARDAENQSLKIVLNSTFGKMLNANHWLYDPMAAFKITVNGQLYMLMLIERLVLNGFKVISANTDGIITKVPKKDIDKYYKICEQWEQDTRFSLEYCFYKQYIRRDVNNYIAQDTDDKVKTKGVFSKEISLKKGFDKPIISLALYRHFIDGVPIAKTIKEHNDIYDFCIAKKIDKKFTNEYHYIKNSKHTIDTLQKSVRYYVSTKGGTLIKTDKETGSTSNYEVGKSVTLFNDAFKPDRFEEYNIDYSYYIHQAQKIINEIINPQLSLWNS